GNCAEACYFLRATAPAGAVRAGLYIKLRRCSGTTAIAGEAGSLDRALSADGTRLQSEGRGTLSSCAESRGRYASAVDRLCSPAGLFQRPLRGFVGFVLTQSPDSATDARRRADAEGIPAGVVCDRYRENSYRWQRAGK